MLASLLNSELFFWLGGLGLFALIVAAQLPIWNWFCNLKTPKLGLAATFVEGAALVAFVGWALVLLSPADVAASSFITKWVVYAVLVTGGYFAVLNSFARFKVGWIGYFTALGALALIIIPVLFMVLLSGNNGAYRSTSAIVIHVILVLILAGLFTFVILFKDYGLKVVKDFYIQDTMPMGTGQKVKVILLNGQSNASGVSRVEYLKKNVSEQDFKRYTSGYKNVMINYFNDNGCNTSGGAFVYCSAGEGYCGDKSFFGPELGIADKLSALYPDETLYIIKYSWGGSNMHTQWRAPSSGKTGELYTAFVNFTKGCLEYLKSKNYDPEIYAMCWMQGESDAWPKINADPYADRSLALIKDTREQFAEYAAPDGIWFLDAGISDSKYWPLYKVINEGKRNNVKKDDRYVFMDTIAAGLEYQKEPVEEPDLAHYDSMGMITLGNMFADEIIKLFEKEKKE